MTRLVELARSYEVDLIPDIAHKDLTKENIAALKNAGLSYSRLDEFGDEAFIERCGKAFNACCGEMRRRLPTVNIKC